MFSFNRGGPSSEDSFAGVILFSQSVKKVRSVNGADLLNVWNDQRKVGILWKNNQGNIGFRYDPEWISRAPFVLSQSLPLISGDYAPEGGLAHRYFSNLLPEGGARENIVLDLKIPNTDFELLRAIGGECAGALSLLPPDQKPSGRRLYHPLSPEELEKWVVQRGSIYANGFAGERPRLSLAGVQNKCPVLMKGGSIFLPQAEAPSSHILKFELAEHRHLPTYETFTTSLAKSIGLPVVDIDLRTAQKVRCVLIARFDRVVDGQGEVHRLHQEDFCQALGIGHEKKYQDLGGPSFAQCFRLLQEASSDPATDTQNLLRWQVFNVLAGNSDGHAKNLSLLYKPHGQTRLAPFYDLICTRAIARIDERLAFDVGGERNPRLVTTRHWDELARRCDVHPRLIKGLVKSDAEGLLDQWEKVQKEFEAQYGHFPALQRIHQVVDNQCRRAIKALP